jgi:hypothetical protein
LDASGNGSIILDKPYSYPNAELLLAVSAIGIENSGNKYSYNYELMSVNQNLENTIVSATNGDHLYVTYQPSLTTDIYSDKVIDLTFIDQANVNINSGTSTYHSIYLPNGSIHLSDK